MSREYVQDKLALAPTEGAGGDLSTPAGLQKLNSYLSSRSYIDGYTPSQSDVTVYKAVGKTPSSNYTHVLRYCLRLKLTYFGGPMMLIFDSYIPCTVFS